MTTQCAFISFHLSNLEFLFEFFLRIENEKFGKWRQ